MSDRVAVLTEAEIVQALRSRGYPHRSRSRASVASIPTSGMELAPMVPGRCSKESPWRIVIGAPPFVSAGTQL
jgi:hypothetical protein